MERRKTVAIGLLGPRLDAGARARRWDRWRPTVALCQHPGTPIDRFELLYERRFEGLAAVLAADIATVSPATEVRPTPIDLADPWNLEEVFTALHRWARAYVFRDDEDYLVHITTGTHVAQICLFLLTESRHLPGRLVQTSPSRERTPPASELPHAEVAGTIDLIDLDLARYDRIAQRFLAERAEAQDSLKAGIATRNAAFNKLIARVEQVALASRAPMLLTGPTGAGKTLLARRIYALKRARRHLSGPFIEVNCATLRGDTAMSALFGHVAGAFTGAARERRGLLREAHKGMLFLDEIGELGADEQAMLLRAIEDRRFLPVGGDREVESEFELVAGTNRDLSAAVTEGRFREDLLARIHIWTFKLPSLAERPEDIAPNLDYELERCAREFNARVTFNREARQRFVAFATAADTRWPGNFRDFSAAITRMATLAVATAGARIDADLVDEELDRLRASWRRERQSPGDLVVEILGETRALALDRFDRVQLEDVLRVCRESPSLSAAGRVLFAASRAEKSAPNDADRLRKYLARHGLLFEDVRRSPDRA